jgi:serine/threonine protein kinase
MKTRVFETAFARYESIKILGEGGAGTVYLVRNESGEQFALKLLDGKKATTQARKRFANEIAFCQRPIHRSIVTILDHGPYQAEENAKPSPFYVMPVYSKSLRDLLEAGLPHDQVLPYFAQVLDGVEAAHLLRAFHRDLKPENILYDEHNNRLIVADFGIAHFSEEDLYTLVETRPGDRLANFLYAAPEQRRRGQPVTESADIYALGLMLNEMFTGDVPWGNNYRMIGSVAPECSYLDDLVAQMLEQNPANRPASIAAIKQQLIGRRNDFVAFQKLNELKQQVVSVSEIIDPLIDDPPRLDDWEYSYDESTLTLILSRPVNDFWIGSLHNLGNITNYMSVAGAGPDRFKVRDNKARVTLREVDIQNAINHFKEWLPNVNRLYELSLRQIKKEEEEADRRQLQREVEKQERMLRLRQNIKI